MKVPKKYSRIFEESRRVKIPDSQTLKLIGTYREEFFGEPVSFGELLEVVE